MNGWYFRNESLEAVLMRAVIARLDEERKARLEAERNLTR